MRCGDEGRVLYMGLTGHAQTGFKHESSYRKCKVL